MDEFGKREPTILIVEDDPHIRAFMESSLELSGFRVLSAGEVNDARVICEEFGLSEIHAVLSDYRLPNETGIELLGWIRDLDSTLSTILITGQGEKSIVEKSISIGVFQYMEKPVTHQELREVLWKAVEQTQLHRKYKEDRIGLQELEHFGQSLNVVIPESLQNRISIFYKPLHEVGGDFFITHDFSDGRMVMLVGDISGHDIRSGYVSTYFQGMFRGCLEGGGNISNALDLFNRSLRQQVLSGAVQTEPVSLSMSAIDFGPKSDEIQHWNYGFTPCQIVSDIGKISEAPFGRFPLGWMEDIDNSPIAISIPGNTTLYIFTDGLVEFANKVELNYFSLLYGIMHSINALDSLPEEPSDDMLAIRYYLNPSLPLNQIFEPILSEHYAGTEVEHIDHLQSNWRRSISFALDDALGDRLYELLICIREGMLNALIHGCERAPDKFAHLQVSLNSDRDRIRVFIDDPGRGHAFNLQQRLEKMTEDTGKNLGLGIIEHLSDELQLENKGTSLVFDFEINPVNGAANTNE